MFILVLEMQLSGQSACLACVPQKEILFLLTIFGVTICDQLTLLLCACGKVVLHSKEHEAEQHCSSHALDAEDREEMEIL